MNQDLSFTLQKYKPTFHPVVKIDPAKDKILSFDFTAANKEITLALITDTPKFSTWVNDKLTASKATFGIGGYNENRTLYSRSNLFSGEQARTLHLGVDIWGVAGTPVHAPLGGMVHSFAFNDNFGDYGATIVLQHQLDTVLFHTLYGHLSLNDLVPLQEGKYISRGELLGHFGEEKENGNWPPHLHFQVIEDMRLYEGDYPGVCSIDEREKYLLNCPDADLILKMMQFI